jgi:hypothetical protein
LAPISSKLGQQHFLDFETNKKGGCYLAGYASADGFQQVILKSLASICRLIGCNAPGGYAIGKTKSRFNTVINA